MRNLEQELKLKLTKREHDVLLNASGARQVLQTNYYFWFDQLPIDTMVRLRVKEDCCVLCYKKRLTENKDILVSEEKECPVDFSLAGDFIQRGIHFTELRDLLGVDLEFDLKCVGSMETYRAKFVVDKWTLELDSNQYLGVCDYELECENRFIEQLEELKSYLFYTYGIVAKHSVPKSQRFFEKLHSK